MDKKFNTKIIERKEINLDRNEYEVVEEFVNFVLNMERGEFHAELVSHRDGRYILLSITDVDKKDLPQRTNRSEKTKVI